MDPPADERDELGVRVRMGTCGSPNVPAARVGLLARGGSAWSNRSSGAEIRVADGTHQGSTNRLVQSLSSPTTVNQLVTTQVLQISQRHANDNDNPVCSGIYIYISPPTQGGALARIISLSMPHWPMAAPYRGGRRPLRDGQRDDSRQGPSPCGRRYISLSRLGCRCRWRWRWEIWST